MRKLSCCSLLFSPFLNISTPLAWASRQSRSISRQLPSCLLYSALYLFPAPLNCYFNTITDRTALLITTLSMNGNFSVLKRCSPAAPARWAFAVITVLYLKARIHASFVKPVVNPKPAEPVTSKAPSSELPSSAIFCQTANGNTLPSLCLICFGLSSTTTGSYLINFFAVQPVLCSNTPDA